MLVLDGGDGIQVWPQGRETFRLDPGLIHVRVEEVGNFAIGGARGCLRFCDLLD